MLRFTAPLIAAVAVLAVTGSASAATTHRDTTVSTVKKSGGSLPNLVYSGTVTSTALGRGTVHQTVHLHGLNVTGAFTITYAKGTIHGVVKAKAKITTKGATFTGTERITGGTGRYKGASGSGSFSGTGALDESSATFRQKGTIRF